MYFLRLSFGGIKIKNRVSFLSGLVLLGPFCYFLDNQNVHAYNSKSVFHNFILRLKNSFSRKGLYKKGAYYERR